MNEETGAQRADVIFPGPQVQYLVKSKWNLWLHHEELTGIGRSWEEDVEREEQRVAPGGVFALR